MGGDEIGRLIDGLSTVAACARVRDGPLLTTWNGDTLDRPVWLHMTERQLADQIRRSAEDGVGAFDDSAVPSIDTGRKLFLLHLEEALDARGPEQFHFRLGEDGIVAM